MNSERMEASSKVDGIPPAGKTAPETNKIKKDEPEMVLIPEGIFFYGRREDDKEASNWEKRQQTIFLPSFYMDVYPVTNSWYCFFLSELKPALVVLNNWIDLSGKWEKEKCRISKKGDDYLVEPGYEDYPVIFVTWFGAKAYAKWVDKRLPYEVEWEKSARGTDGWGYPWGNFFDKNRCNSNESGFGHATSVMAYPEGKSFYGCFDLAGNVWDWCADWFVESNDKIGSRLKGPKAGSTRIVRGGSWANDMDCCQASFRGCDDPAHHWSFCGFRLVRDCL